MAGASLRDYVVLPALCAGGCGKRILVNSHGKYCEDCKVRIRHEQNHQWKMRRKDHVGDVA